MSLIEKNSQEVVQPAKVGVCLYSGCVLVFLLKILINGFESLSCALRFGDFEKTGIPLKADECPFESTHCVRF
jgi:hypothetical protein